MKMFITRLLVLLVLVTVGVKVKAQKEGNVTTIILVRHAEKETTTGNDPALTIAGKTRAQKLATMFPNARPDEMYSTPYIRTRETLTPWSKASGVAIADYNPADQPEFADELKKKKGKTIVIAGHSNTIPALVNLLLDADKYKTLDDSVYNKIFVITIKKGKAKSKVIEY
jgi:broad specificity phosphatase PhoE